MDTPTPDELDAATIDLIFALRDSLTDDGPSRMDFWAGRAASAIETAAAGADSAGQAITIAARKLQIETLSASAAPVALRAGEVIDRDFQAWASHVARNIVYIVAVAYVAREARSKTKTAKTAEPVRESVEEPMF